MYCPFPLAGSALSKDDSGEYWEGSIEKIDPSRTKALNYPALASPYRGDLPVVQTGIEPGKAKAYVEAPKPILVGTYYAVYVQLDQFPPHIKYENTGYLQIKGKPESWLLNFLQYLQRIIRRESNF